MNNPVNSRQETLSARLRCYYADPAKAAERPHCEGVGVVSYASIVLCSMCDKMRSSVGRTEAGRKLAGGELLELIDAAKELSRSEERVARAVYVPDAAGKTPAQEPKEQNRTHKLWVGSPRDGISIARSPGSSGPVICTTPGSTGPRAAERGALRHYQGGGNGPTRM